MADIELRTEVSVQAARHNDAMKHFTSAELRFSTLQDVNLVVAVLAAMCPDPDKVSPGLIELVLNAVEHGNLAITYDEKKHFMYENTWEEEINRRLAHPEFNERYGTVVFERKNGIIRFVITDQGKGFDWSKYLELDPARSMDPNGRGIAMARRSSFSTLEYQGTGNVVVATVAD
jgi:anti-sigma regulatory factor (Ser/Thr protein kinase)